MQEKQSQAPKLSVFSLVMITSAIVLSIRNLPMMAETGLCMIFFVLVTVLAFLIPSALISAELATGWPKQGGVYAWVKEAFGDKFGFLAIWLQWIQMPFAMVIILSFVAGSLAFVFNPALSNNGLFILAVIIIVYWGLTFLNLRGMKTSSLISTICVIAGVFIPGALIIIFGIIYVLGGNPVQLSFDLTPKNIFPNLRDMCNIALMAGFFFAFAGMEVSASHAGEVTNPRRNYPFAILLAGIMLIIVNVMGAMSVAVVVPHAKISLVAGIMEAIGYFFSTFHMSWLVPVFAILTGLGAIGQVSTWIVGPVKGLLATAENGDLPPFFQRVNKNGIPTNLLFAQASLVSIIGILFAVIPSINTSFLIVLNMTILIYLLMYILMFLAAIRLRYKEPDTPRAYRIPGGGNIGMWLVAGTGLLACLFAIFAGFFPPSQLKINNPVLYAASLVTGTLIMAVIPFIIYKVRKPGWAPKQKTVQPEQ